MGRRAVVTCIGPSGERLSRIANIMSDGEHGRAAGRCGLGAVMGSKRLKAIAVSATKTEPPQLRDGFRESISSLMPQVKERAKMPSTFGTSGAFLGAEKLGDLPIKNWRLGSWQEEAQKLSGQTIAETILTGRYSCSNCPIGCGRVVRVPEGPYGGGIGGGPEYETLAAFGSMCLVNDLSAVAKANEFCNRYGIDTISAGNIIAFAMEAYGRGHPQEKGSGRDSPGLGRCGRPAGTPPESQREGIGELLSEGIRISAERIGQGSETFHARQGSRICNARSQGLQ